MEANSKLQPLAAFVGEWTTESVHPLLPGRTFHGRTSVETMDGLTWTWSRESEEFSQRMHMTMAADRSSIVSKGEMSRNNATWEPDLQVTYTRAQSS
jgi:hypothetical protein